MVVGIIYIPAKAKALPHEGALALVNQPTLVMHHTHLHFEDSVLRES